LTSASNSQLGFSFLVSNDAGQDDRFSGAFGILKEAIAARAFPACSLAVTYRGELIAHKALGRLTYDASSPAVSAASIFDVASLTKVIATTTMAMILYERGVLDLETPVAAVVPEFVASEFAGSEFTASEFAENVARRSNVTLRMLLAHTSGLPAYEKLFLRAKTREDLLRAAFAVELTADPGTHAEYSDIGFIILGVALERLADEPLGRFCQREVFGPLAMSHTTFNPAKTLREKIPPTADEREPGQRAGVTPVRAADSATRSTFRNRIIQGEAQDENASVLGGVAGHAGLFSTAEDLARFAHAMLNGGHPILRADTIDLFTRLESAPEGTSRALGWDTPSTPSQSGRYFSARSYGHLGYTGTSLWIDPERQLSITLLTNRTWPDCQNQAIKQVRPAFHDAVIEALPKTSGTGTKS